MTDTFPGLTEMAKAADSAAEVLRVLSNPGRLRILCALADGEKSVGALEQLLGVRQAYVSGQLARLRAEGLVSAERDGRTVRYRIADPRIAPILQRLTEVFCPRH
tara:strand:+ start:219 stop:533 length:315 start_codon:yes stop_codon:yes gene_type:complete